MTCPKTAIITCSSRGMEQSIAELFAIEGYNVLINYNNSLKVFSTALKQP